MSITEEAVRTAAEPTDASAAYSAFKRSATVCIASVGAKFDVTLSLTLESDGWGAVKIVDLATLTPPRSLKTRIENNASDLWVVNLTCTDACKEVRPAPSLIFDFLHQEPTPTLVLTPDAGAQSREILNAFRPALSSGAADFIPLSDSLLREGLEKHVEVWEELKTRIDILHTRFLQIKACKAVENTPASIDEGTASITDAFAARTLAPFPIAPEPVSGRVITELHHPANGRLDAKRMALFFGLPASALAKIVGARAQTLGKTPDAPALQEKLAPFYFVATSLLDMLQTPEAARAWLNLPNSEFDGKTPLQVVKEGEIEVVALLLRNVLLGQPS